MKNRRLLVLGLICIGNIRCAEAGGDALARAMAIEDGTPEQRLVELAGPPTVRKEPSQECVAKGGTHSVAYEKRTLWLGGRLGSDLSSQLVVCIDSSGKVVSKDYYQY